ncbi:signal transduction histidine kinase [Duganella sp. SG902]|uniref:sensor histidine kinase n=1 Tax=Duganella sp. SG902 TaxID=2587016 RepID=UPI0017A2ECF3|nr:histidine kinase [Duganella sp. SG902]NVM77492.1 signal transduction histidine kinase [Duganella sp. SG902]
MIEYLAIFGVVYGIWFGGFDGGTNGCPSRIVRSDDPCPAISAHTSAMELDDKKTTIRMWCIYVSSWAAYLLLVGLALQLDELRQGRFDTRVVTILLKSTPHALFLALLWPLSGYLERKRLTLWRIFLTHLGCALVYAVTCYLLIWFLLGLRQAPAWYMWPALYAMMTYFVIAAMFHMVRADNARRRQAAAAQLAQNLAVESEMNALRNKLNPHFLFNTLHSIIALTRKNPAGAEAALFQFSAMLRYILDTEKSDSSQVTLSDELSFVRDYLELESLRLGPRLQVKWDLDDGISGCVLPALLLQPLVENSIKHAFNPHSRPGTIMIRTSVDELTQTLNLEVADDGPGAESFTPGRSNGLGIRTLARRLELEYGARGALVIKTAPGMGFVVTISMPLAFA